MGAVDAVGFADSFAAVGLQKAVVGAAGRYGQSVFVVRNMGSAASVDD